MTGIQGIVLIGKNVLYHLGSDICGVKYIVHHFNLIFSNYRGFRHMLFTPRGIEEFLNTKDIK